MRADPLSRFDCTATLLPLVKEANSRNLVPILSVQRDTRGETEGEVIGVWKRSTEENHVSAEVERQEQQQGIPQRVTGSVTDICVQCNPLNGSLDTWVRRH